MEEQVGVEGEVVGRQVRGASPCTRSRQAHPHMPARVQTSSRQAQQRCSSPSRQAAPAGRQPQQAVLAGSHPWQQPLWAGSAGRLTRVGQRRKVHARHGGAPQALPGRRKHANAAADGLCSQLVIPSDHHHTDAGGLAVLDGRTHLHGCGGEGKGGVFVLILCKYCAGLCQF